jgi:hypothetical protein
MGRFLEIARETEGLPAPPEQRLVPSPAAINLPFPVPPLKPVSVTEPPFDALASAVLNILVDADQPVPHTEIVRQMGSRGHDKTAARQAIARCQKRCWIEHNLTTGYVLS